MSTDSHFSHLAWATQPRKQGGLGPDLKLPLIADKSMSIARDYSVLIEEEGIALRGLFLIDPKGILRSVCFSILCFRFSFFRPTPRAPDNPARRPREPC